MATITGNDDVPVLQPDACVAPGNQVRVARGARKAFELPGETQPMSLGDASGQSHVLACPVIVTGFDGVS